MSDSTTPLIQTITPERWAGLSMNFIDAGYVGLLVKNGQLVRKLEPGRHFSFALPYLEQCQIVLVDGKIRNLVVESQGDFVSRDQYLVNISLSIMYQVIDPKRVALELSDPIASLTSAIKDQLGVIVTVMRLEQLTQVGRVKIRDYLLTNLDSFYTLGFNLDDVRVSDISFPQKPGVVRQLEGLTARAEAEHEASLKQASKLQASNLEEQTVTFSTNPTGASAQTSAKENKKLPPKAAQSPLPPTTLADPGVNFATARLVNSGSKLAIPIAANPFMIGREPQNTLVMTDEHCSRSHARIEKVESPEGLVRYQLTDIGSSNGTHLNGQRLVSHQPTPLRPGDRIRIGKEEWLFEI